MQVIFYYKGEAQTWTVTASSLLQVYDWLKFAQPEAFHLVQSQPFSFTVATDDPEQRPVSLHPAAVSSDLSQYSLLVIAQPIQGSMIFSGISTAIAAALASAGVGAVAASIVGSIVATVVSIGISYALGQVIQMLSPHKKNTQTNSIDSALAQKNSLFNGVQNIREQGGAVPIILGECFVGGMVISLRVSTSELLTPAMPVLNIPTAMTPSYEGKWLTLTRV